MKETCAPGNIERESMRLIGEELDRRGVTTLPGREAVVKRVLHATADFDYLETLRIGCDPASFDAHALRRGVLVTDTNMALAGISRPALRRLDMAAYCFMAEEAVAREARRRGITRAAVAMEYALERYPGAVLAVGNAPTALLRLRELMEAGARPSLVIAVPVGFVNVVESKEQLWDECIRRRIPVIAAMGRKGGSTVAAAICNAILYAAAGMLDPAAR